MTILIFTLYLISGAMGFDMIGYSGGSLIMYFKYQQSGQNTKYFCTEFTNPKSQKQCILINPGQAQTTFSYKDKVFLFDNPGAFTVIYRHLGVQDAGTYQCGEQGVWNYDVRVTINTDPCCTSPKTVTGYLGETVTISCSYPEAIKDNYKYFFKFSDVYIITQVATTIEVQQGRFSISEDKGSRLLTVRIREVREDDGGLYSCGVGVGGTSFNYYTLFPEIRLQVTAFRATNRTTSISPSKDGSSSVVIPLCVCVVLLLIGGSALIFYRLRCRRTQDSSCCRRRSGRNETGDADYENDTPRNQNDVSRGQVYQNMKLNTNQSLSFYQHLDPERRATDSFYHSLNPRPTQN